MSIGEFLADATTQLPASMATHVPVRPRQWITNHHNHRQQWRAFNDDVEQEVPPGVVPMGAAFTSVRPPHPLARPLDPGVEVALQVLILRGVLRGGL